MGIIRGEKIEAIALLTPGRELHEDQGEGTHHDVLEEECHKSFQKGQLLGEKVGYGKALEESRALFKLLQQLTDQLLVRKKRLLDQLKPEVIEFAIAVCEHVMRRELEKPEMLAELIEQLLALAAEQMEVGNITLVLSAEDAKLIKERLHLLPLESQSEFRLHVRADSLVKRGDFLIETSGSLLHFDLRRELADLKSKVLQV